MQPKRNLQDFEREQAELDKQQISKEESNLFSSNDNGNYMADKSANSINSSFNSKNNKIFNDLGGPSEIKSKFDASR